MKYSILGLVAVVAFLAFASYHFHQKSAVDHYANKRHIAEVETKVRPARFEDMKMSTVEVRSPASKD